MRLKPGSLLLTMAGCAAASLGAGLALELTAPDFSWHQAGLHSAMEAVGGLAGVAMAAVLLRRGAAAGGRRRDGLALGFLAMGLLEEFHAVAPPGNGFILLRGAASLAGGLGFALVWLPEPAPDSARARRLPWLVAAGAVAVGSWVLAFPEALPAMTRQGAFTPTAVAPTSLACLLFLSAAGRLLLDHRRSGAPQDALFALLALMYSLAEFMFVYSSLWDSRWWFWHGLRLLASLLVLGHLARGYLGLIADLKHSLAQTREAEDTLRASERDLRRLLEERERMARDLHDGIIQSIYAQVLGLERCRRLVGSRPEEARAQLAAGLAELRRVIRELRGHLKGLTPRVMSGAELEAAVDALGRTLREARGFHVERRLDPAATGRLTPEQAEQVLYVVREALSNSLRHAGAGAATVSLEDTGAALRLVVEDDGQGFDPAAAAERGRGLANMAARARSLGGRFGVASAPGRGTRVEVEIPMERTHAVT